MCTLQFVWLDSYFWDIRRGYRPRLSFPDFVLFISSQSQKKTKTLDRDRVTDREGDSERNLKEMCETAVEQIDQKWRVGKKIDAFHQWRKSASRRVKSGKFVREPVLLLLCPRREPQWSFVRPFFPLSGVKYQARKSRRQRLPLPPPLDRGGIVIGMPRKEARGHRRPDSVDRGRVVILQLAAKKK